MKKYWFIAFTLLQSAFCLHAEQGMIQPFNPDLKVIQRLQSLGLEIPYDSLFNQDKSSIKDAVVIFGNGCTGVMVSDQGLVFTNHHCGFGAIQSLSNKQHDYLKDGFASQSRENEISSPDLSVSFLMRSLDITKKIASAIPKNSDEFKRGLVIDSLSKIVTDSVEKDSLLEAKVVSFFGGNEYRLLIYKVYRDIRLVFAPPTCIGKFGGETDNWMWPRHNSDFAVFRVYADSLGNPCEYSAANIPYKPKYVATISTEGIKENDLALTIGNPGSTHRYLTTEGVKEVMETVNIPRIEVRGVKQQIWKKRMIENQSIRIKYDSKFARSANYYKNSIGMNDAIKNNKLLEEKKLEAIELQDRIEGNKEFKGKYDSVQINLATNYKKRETIRKNINYLKEAFNSSSDLLAIAKKYSAFDTKGDAKEKGSLIKDISKIYRDFDSSVEQEVLTAMFKLYQEKVSIAYQPACYKEVSKKYKNNFDKYVRHLCSKTIFNDSAKLFKLIRKNEFKAIEKDPIYTLSMGIEEELNVMQQDVASIDLSISEGERLYIAALREIYPDSIYFPDANSTMRLSYGTIKGYSPRNAVTYQYYTTKDGILEKEHTGNPDYFIKPALLEKLNKPVPSKFVNNKGELQTCFLTTNDITGGNSGSPMFNKKGQLLGLAFDGNWESLSGDLKFNNKLQRCIGVDIRYILYVISQISDMPQLLNELRITNQK
ncbi:MAG: S46 family peptidase [Bacteroidales bacterium]|nr:S46 family peptidase [Bacteroidales bacterium]